MKFFLDSAIVHPREVFRPAVAESAAAIILIHNHPSGLLEPSEADLAVAATLYEEGLGSAIVDNEATDLYVVVEPPAPRRVEALDLEEVARSRRLFPFLSDRRPKVYT